MHIHVPALLTFTEYRISLNLTTQKRPSVIGHPYYTVGEVVLIRR